MALTSPVQGGDGGQLPGWVDLDFECSTVCQILPGLMRIRQKQVGN